MRPVSTGDLTGPAAVDMLADCVPPARCPVPCRHRWIAWLSCVAVSAAVGADVEDAVDALTPRERATAEQLDRIADGFSRSADPAVRILFSTNGLDQHADGTIRWHETVPVAELVDQARGSTDPLVLDLLLRRCSNDDAACDRLDLATRWAAADTQNQVAWLMLASIRQERKDPDGARATFLRAARASTWHDHYDDAIRRSAKALPADLSPPIRVAAFDMIFVRAGLVLPFVASHTLGDYCKERGAAREACATIVATMVRDADTLVDLIFAAPFAARAHVDPSVVAQYQQTSDAVRWGMTGMLATHPISTESPELDDSPALRERLRQMDFRIALGERRWAERYLTEQHVGEVEAAKRYVASLPESQLQRRTKSLQVD